VGALIRRLVRNTFPFFTLHRRQQCERESLQYLAGHADPRTTRLYDRRQKKVSRRIVEKISI
jgi:hypothetical protein